MDTQQFGGSFQGLIDRFHGRFGENGSALDLVKMVVDAFPQFQDEVNYAGRTGLPHLHFTRLGFN